MVEITSMSVATTGVRGAYRNAQDLNGAALPAVQHQEGASFALIGIGPRLGSGRARIRDVLGHDLEPLALRMHSAGCDRTYGS